MATSPSALTAIRGEPANWPLQAQGTDGSALTGVFGGSETLACQLFYGADAALAVVPTAAWIDGPSGQYLLSLSALQTTALAPGRYTLTVEVASGAAPGPLLEAVLVIEPAPVDGTGLLRSLAQPADFAAVAADRAADPGVTAALEAATRSIEAYCRRPLVLDDHDHRARPGRTRRIYLEAWPVQGEPILSYDLAVAGSIFNADASTNQQASVSMVPASPTSGRVATLTLRRTASGVATVDTFALSDYATIAGLFAAVSAAGGGWAVVSPGSAPAPNFRNLLLLPPGRINGQSGQAGALGRQVAVTVYATEATDYDLDTRTGVVELTENRPEAFRYPDRAFGWGHGFAWSGAGRPQHADVRCQYRAGYAIAQADLALGYDPVPADLKLACILVAKAILAAPATVGAVKQQTVGPQQTTVRADASSIPLSAQPLLKQYMNYRSGGWGS